jgi:hypothetical protein
MSTEEVTMAVSDALVQRPIRTIDLDAIAEAVKRLVVATDTSPASEQRVEEIIDTAAQRYISALPKLSPPLDQDSFISRIAAALPLPAPTVDARLDAVVSTGTELRLLLQKILDVTNATAVDAEERQMDELASLRGEAQAARAANVELQASLARSDDVATTAQVERDALKATAALDRKELMR